MDNRQADHQASIIDMEGKLFDEVVSILIDLGSKYSCISLILVDKCCLIRKLHVESWLVK